MPNTDCIILKVVESAVNDNKDKDNVIYIFYDINEKQFFIRGKRFNDGVSFNSYSFLADEAKTIQNFIEVITSNDSNIVYELINYKNLQYESDDITFEYLEKNSTHLNQLVSFYPENYCSRTLNKLLCVIQSLYNHY